MGNSLTVFNQEAFVKMVTSSVTKNLTSVSNSAVTSAYTNHKIQVKAGTVYLKNCKMGFATNLTTNMTMIAKMSSDQTTSTSSKIVKDIQTEMSNVAKQSMDGFTLASFNNAIMSAKTTTELSAIVETTVETELNSRFKESVEDQSIIIWTPQHIRCRAGSEVYLNTMTIIEVSSEIISNAIVSSIATNSVLDKLKTDLQASSEQKVKGITLLAVIGGIIVVVIIAVIIYIVVSKQEGDGADSTPAAAAAAASGLDSGAIKKLAVTGAAFAVGGPGAAAIASKVT